MLRFLTAGESHGRQLTAILEGIPAGMAIDIAQINHQLARRQKGHGRGLRMQIEHDSVEIVSGLRHGRTLGSPITLTIINDDWINWSATMHPTEPVGQSADGETSASARLVHRPRPGHADLAGGVKLGHRDLRNVLERASARETAARVAVGAVARQLLAHFDIAIASHVVRIGDVSLDEIIQVEDMSSFIEAVERSPVRCIHEPTGRAMIAAIDEAKKQKDTLGGVAEVIVRGLPVGLGGFSQWSQRLDSRLAGAMMSIPSVKGVEIGLGFEGAGRRGSSVHDEIFRDAGGDPRRKGYCRRTNNAGGLEGGISNGEDVTIRVAAKPISTLTQPLRTVDINTGEAARAVVERADVCVVPAVAVIGEAVAALVLAEAFLEKFGADNIEETGRNFATWLDAEF